MRSSHAPVPSPVLQTVRFPLHVISCTSEQGEGASARILETPNPRSQGWISARFCDFPQVLGFELCTPAPPASASCSTAATGAAASSNP